MCGWRGEISATEAYAKRESLSSMYLTGLRCTVLISRALCLRGSVSSDSRRICPAERSPAPPPEPRSSLILAARRLIFSICSFPIESIYKVQSELKIRTFLCESHDAPIRVQYAETLPRLVDVGQKRPALRRQCPTAYRDDIWRVHHRHIVIRLIGYQRFLRASV